MYVINRTYVYCLFIIHIYVLHNLEIYKMDKKGFDDFICIFLYRTNIST